MSTEQAPISRDDIESKFREIKDEVDSVRSSAKSKAIPAGVAGGILILLIMYLMGRRVGSKRSAMVEIRRL
jgi:hypothetical protein